MIESPQSFVSTSSFDKMAFERGYRKQHGEVEGWRHYSSTTAKGNIWLAAEDSGKKLLAIDHGGVIAELGLEACQIVSPGQVCYRLEDMASLYDAMSRLYDLSISLPDAPYQEFLQKTKDLPKTTEAERLVVQRVGQDIFRERLLAYWQGRCPLTGISDKSLLRASHIKPWKDCESDEERLDVHNGLLLSALWDAAFDRGLVTFEDDGQPQFSKQLSEEASAHLKWEKPLQLNDLHREKLAWHRNELFKVG